MANYAFSVANGPRRRPVQRLVFCRVCSRIELPFFQEQRINLLEVLITSYNRQRMLLGNGSNPNVVVRQWMSFRFQFVLDLSVMLRCLPFICLYSFRIRLQWLAT